VILISVWQCKIKHDGSEKEFSPGDLAAGYDAG
jgi:hypothetical protein